MSRTQPNPGGQEKEELPSLEGDPLGQRKDGPLGEPDRLGDDEKPRREIGQTNQDVPPDGVVKRHDRAGGREHLLHHLGAGGVDKVMIGVGPGQRHDQRKSLRRGEPAGNRSRAVGMKRMNQLGGEIVDARPRVSLRDLFEVNHQGAHPSGSKPFKNPSDRDGVSSDRGEVKWSHERHTHGQFTKEKLSQGTRNNR